MNRFLFVIIISLSFYTIGLAQPSYVPQNGLVTWWEVDNGFENIYSTDFDGTPTNVDFVDDRNNIANGAAYFSGSNSFVKVDHDEALNFDNNGSYSISFWINIEANPNNGPESGVIAKWNEILSSSYPIRIGTTDLNDGNSKLTWRIYSSQPSSQHYLHTILKNDCFYHVSYVVDNYVCKLYLNGQFEDSVSFTSGNYDNNDDLYIGKRHVGAPREFKGTLDEVGVWERALTPQEVSDLYGMQGQVNCSDAPSPCLTEYVYDTVNNACTAYTWTVNRATYYESGIYTESIESLSNEGCDSIVYVLDLTIDCNLYGSVATSNSNEDNCDGIAEATVNGGVSPYSFVYSSGDSTAIATDLCPGIYSLEITDQQSGVYTTDFVITDLSVNYTNDSTYNTYLDSLFTSAIEECNINVDEEIDWFYVDIDSAEWLDENLVKLTWYVSQNDEVYTFTTVYYLPEDALDEYAYTLTVYCEEEGRSLLKSINFTHKPQRSASISDNLLTHTFNLYPNPTNGNFQIEVETDLIGQPVVITDAMGKLVRTEVIQSKVSTFEVSDLPKGVYFVQVHTAHGKIAKRLVKQ